MFILQELFFFLFWIDEMTHVLQSCLQRRLDILLGSEERTRIQLILSLWEPEERDCQEFSEILRDIKEVLSPSQFEETKVLTHALHIHIEIPESP